MCAQCYFERRISAVAKDDDCLLQLSSFAGRSTHWSGMRLEMAAKRPAPMLPARFEEFVRQGMEAGSIKFTNGKDATEIVIPQYAIGFKRLMEEVVSLEFSNLGWGDADAIELAIALEHAHSHGGLRRVTKLELMRNNISDDGMAAIASMLRGGAMPKLKTKGLMISFNPASKRAQDEVWAAFKSRGKAK